MSRRFARWSAGRLRRALSRLGRRVFGEPQCFDPVDVKNFADIQEELLSRGYGWDCARHKWIKERPATQRKEHERNIPPGPGPAESEVRTSRNVELLPGAE